MKTIDFENVNSVFISIGGSSGETRIKSIPGYWTSPLNGTKGTTTNPSAAIGTRGEKQVTISDKNPWRILRVHYKSNGIGGRTKVSLYGASSSPTLTFYAGDGYSSEGVKDIDFGSSSISHVLDIDSMNLTRVDDPTSSPTPAGAATLQYEIIG